MNDKKERKGRRGECIRIIRYGVKHESWRLKNEKHEILRTG